MSILMSKIAVIGSGYWGKNLIRNYHQLGVLKIICDKNESILSNFKEQYPDVETCMALSDVLNQKEIDGVVIATPAETHYDLAREALLADKHVYVEKPLVLDEKQGEDLIALAKDRKRVLMVGHLLQYHPAFVRLKEMVHSGELGRINYIYSNRLNLGKIRREENILWSFAPHDISMILCLAGETASNVSAVGGFYLHKKIADVTTTHLEFPSGLQSHIFVSWLHPFKEQKLVVVGEQKMAVFDDTLPWSDKLQLFSHKINWQSGMPVPAKAEPESVEINQGEPLRAECEHFLHCLKSGSEPVTDGKEGLQVLKILTAAQQSMDSGGCKITLQSADINTILHKSSEQALQSSPQSSIDHDSVPYFVHETAVIDSNCKIGSGSKIWHFSHILSNSEIGEKCNIGQNVSIGPEVKIGNNCKIQNNVSVYKGVTLEDGVFCGPSMVFTNIYNPRAEISKIDQVRPTLVKHGATLGANCTIICGVTIGRYAFVGAGAVVTHNVPDHAMVAGNTARAIGWACTCGERLTDNYECQTCGRFFMRTDQGLKEKL